MISKKETMKRVTWFLQNVCNVEDIGDREFSYTNARFFVYMDCQEHGCFESFYDFKTEEQVNQIIKHQMVNAKHSWHNVFIFDVLKNKLLTAHI